MFYSILRFAMTLLRVHEMKMILWLPLMMMMMMMVVLLMVVDIIISIAICCVLYFIITSIKYGWSLCVCARRIIRANEMIHLDVNNTRVTDLLDWLEFFWIREGKKAVNNSLARYPIIHNLCCVWTRIGEFIVCNMNGKTSMVMVYYCWLL